jgi:hypothetical protein
VDLEQRRVALALLESGGPRDPGLDLRAVLGRRGEPLGLDELAA